MTISENTVVFPTNALTLIEARMKTIDASIYTFQRPLRLVDPPTSIGLFAQNWDPLDDSIEFKGLPTPAVEPTLSRYQLMVQGMVSDTDEIRGQAKHSVLAKMIRSILYRDAPLRVGLAALSVSMSGSTETLKRFGIRRGIYLSNQLDSDFVFLYTLECWLETETV